MAEKETTMKLKVNLQCEKCYKKVKKVLSKFPQIREQKHLPKDNLVEIKVVSCNPEKIRDKICCKGGGAIKTIEIVEPQKPNPPQKPKPEPREAKPSTPSVEPSNPAPKPDPMPPVRVPTRVCCAECSEGRPGGPCFQGCHGPLICYGWCYGRPVYDCYGGPRPYYVSHCYQYFSDENASGCSIM